MPKRVKKTVPKKNKPNSRTEGFNNDSNGTVPKKKCYKPNPEDSIAKSKKLTEKLKNTKLTAKRSGRPSTCSDESRICGNGKPMPSLADLEKMFEDSDNDEEHKIGTPKKSEPDLSQITPEKPIIVTEEKLTSPGTIKKIADKMLDLISNLPDPILIDDGPPPPIIPPKKRKKPEVPYIVGCKDRPKVPEKPSVNFCKGDDYGVEHNKGGDDDDECPKKRAKITKAVNISKSIFNAKSDEISAWLKDIDKAEQSDGSSDSNKTVEYEVSGGPRSFSPLPSTSKDNEIISQNDKRFIDSLVSETISEDSAHSACSIVDNTNATIIIDDDEVITSDENKVKILADDCIEVIDVKDEKDNMKIARKCENSEIILEDEYDDCYKFIYTDLSDANVPEIIDVDAVIAENKAIIEKYSKVEKLNSVTHVDSSTISALDNNATVSKTELNRTDNLENTLLDSNANNHEDVSPFNSAAVQIQEIVTGFFQTNTMRGTTNYKSRSKDRSNYDLFKNFTNWIQSLNTTHSNSRVQTTEVRNAHIVTDEVIEIDDDYIPTVNIADHTSPRSRKRNRLPNTLPHYQPTPNNSSPILLCPCNCDKHDREAFHRIPVQQNPQPASMQPPPVQFSPVRPPPVQPPPVQPPLVQNSSPARKSIGDCPICMDNLANNSVASTTCGHVFCMECIKAAVKANGKRCPTCRKTLKGIGFHQLFL